MWINGVINGIYEDLLRFNGDIISIYLLYVEKPIFLCCFSWYQAGTSQYVAIDATYLFATVANEASIEL